MKKQYITPETETILMTTTGMLAASAPINSGTTVTPGNADAPGAFGFEDYE